MTIKEIELFNFRIYKGENIIELTTEGDKNIFIISGRNGLVFVWQKYAGS